MDDPETKTPAKIWNPAFIGIFVTNALLGLSQMMVNTLIALFADSLGATSTIVGFVVSLFAYTALAFKVFSAPAIDSFNRKFLLIGTACVIMVSYICLSLSSDVGMLMWARLLQGAGMAFMGPCCLAIAADSLPVERMGTGIGYFSLANAVCMAIGPATGLYLANAIGYQLTFAIGAGMMSIAAITACFIRAPHNKRRPFKISPDRIFAKEAIVPASIACLLSLAYCNINSFLVLYANDVGVTANMGLFFTVYAITMLVSRPLVGRMLDLIGAVKVLIPSMACFAAAFLLISVSTELWMFLVAACISAFGFGAALPALQTICMRCVPSSKRGAAGSANYVGLDVGNIAGPLIAGMVVEACGYQTMWVVMLIPVGVAAVVALTNRENLDAPTASE